MDTTKNLGNLARLSTLMGVMSNGGGLHHIQDIIAAYTRLDITTIALILAFFGSISGALKSLRGGVFKIYSWITEFFTASVSIAGKDRLNREILNWVGANVLDRQNIRVLTAQTKSSGGDMATIGDRYAKMARAVLGLMSSQGEEQQKSMPIQYFPTFGTTWFIHDRKIFLVKRVGHATHTAVNEYQGVAEGSEPLVVTCFGRSVDPIKRFLETCRKFGEAQRESFTTIRSSQGRSYSGDRGTTTLKPLRPLETVHFDEAIKKDLVADMRRYLDPKTRKFYTSRGIPYRRGYLLHGIPGTGKTSLSTALAGLFGLDLYMVHVPSISSDENLVNMFAALPPNCIVLLEDIDAVGAERKKKEDVMHSGYGENLSQREELMKVSSPDSPESSRCTLSGLLNVLDGVASQEGRIVIMTTNHADKLDKALVRPGRIDKRVYLGHISPQSAELMFLRMYALDSDSPPDSPVNFDLQNIDLKTLASDFGNKLRDTSFTPAQVQGYLLDHIEFPVRAVKEATAWVAEEKVRVAKQSARLMGRMNLMQEVVPENVKAAAKNLDMAGPVTGTRIRPTPNIVLGGNAFGSLAGMEQVLGDTVAEMIDGESLVEGDETLKGGEEALEVGKIKISEGPVDKAA